MKKVEVNIGKEMSELFPKVLIKDLRTTTYYPCYKEFVKIDWSKNN